VNFLQDKERLPTLKLSQYSHKATQNTQARMLWNVLIVLQKAVNINFFLLMIAFHTSNLQRTLVTQASPVAGTSGSSHPYSINASEGKIVVLGTVSPMKYILSDLGALEIGSTLLPVSPVDTFCFLCAFKPLDGACCSTKNVGAIVDTVVALFVDSLREYLRDIIVEPSK
jgi:hypothetical protein